MDVKNTHSITKTEISVFGRQALDAERRRSPSLAGKVLRLRSVAVMEATQQNENKLNVDHQTKQNTIPNMRACVCGL